ncbi:hypothetical protein SEA_ENYGMA_222 [Streptomyces phage Enygma]
MVYLRVGGWAMVVEDHWIGPTNYKNRYGRVLIITRRKVVILFPGNNDPVDVSINKVVAYQPPDKEIR